MLTAARRTILLCLSAPFAAHAQLPVRGDIASPLSHPLILGEATLLSKGEVVFVLRNRYFHIPSRVVSGLRIQPNLGVTWAPAGWLEVGLEAQTVDNAGPGPQGRFVASRTTVDSGSGNFFQELTAIAKLRLRASEDHARALSLAVSLSNGNRSYLLHEIATGATTAEDKQSVVPRVELPATWSSKRWTFTLSPTVAFFEADNAMFLRRPPVAEPGRFGTTAGIAAGVVFRAGHAWSGWGDAFVPATGANSISRASGLPVRTVTYNAGVRYVVHTALAADVFVSNALGDAGALGLVADREYTSLGVAVAVAPRARTRGSSSRGRSPVEAASATVRAGNRALHASLGTGIVPDLAAGAFLDNVSGTLDESLLGVIGTMRVIAQSNGAPLSVSAEFSASRSNNVFVNLLAGRVDEFERLGLEKSGFSLGDENEREGKLYVLTLAVPIERALARGGRISAGPTVGLVQRRGVQLAGIRVDVSVPLSRSVEATVGTGATMGPRGNALVSEGRVHRVPWDAGFAWRPGWLGSRLELTGYVRNRVGESPFLSMRTFANGRVSFGAGLGARLW